MRRTVAWLTSRVFGTRFGLALLLAVVIAAIVGVAQLVGGGRSDDPGIRTDRGTEISTRVSPSAGDDGENSPPPVPEPSTSPGAPGPDNVATAFATAWVNHRNVDATGWLARLRPHITTALAEKLSGVDPAGVPADRLTGPAQVIPRGDSFVEVNIPVDSGVLRLRLVATGGRWFVDGVDWERG